VLLLLLIEVEKRGEGPFPSQNDEKEGNREGSESCGGFEQAKRKPHFFGLCAGEKRRGWFPG